MWNQRLRVFISYSHADRRLAEQIVRVLEQNGLYPIWDPDFELGRGFHEQIKTRIAHAHVFLPIVTKNSSERGWVHQEIGFAMALNVPVLPVGQGIVPGQMLEQLLAVRLDRDLKNIDQQLSYEAIARLVARFRDPALAFYTCTQLPEERATMMTRYADELLEQSEVGEVRQLGALSSFHIPDEVVADKVWRNRYPPGAFPGLYHCKLQRAERLALEKHARVAGCRLIIDVDVHLGLGRGPQVVRLNCLQRFLDSMPDELIIVAVDPSVGTGDNVTIVGDWFAAESVSMKGPRQTNFTTHAPSMQSRIEQFDENLNALLNKSRTRPKDSRRAAIRIIDRKLRKLQRGRVG